ncbi:MAG: hypothetical protein ACKOET_21020, partial [Verrucomicrobiota bacterium]
MDDDVKPGETEGRKSEGGLRKRVERRRSGGSRRFAVVFVILLGVLVAGGVAARPVWRLVKRQRARNLAVGALRDLEAGRLNEAARAARTASLMAPDQLEVLQAITRLSLRSPSVAYLPYWESLLARREVTPEDRIAFVRFALIVRKFDLAGVQLARLVQERPRDREILSLLVDHNSGRGAAVEAAEAGRRLLDQTGPEPAVEFRLANLLLRCPGTRDQVEGRRLLWALAV